MTAIVNLWKILCFGVIVFVFLLVFSRGYKSTEFDYPLFLGDWDEPFTINSAINVFYKKGNPLFYNYGGVSVYPQSLVFFIYKKITGKEPHYRGAGEKVPNSWPILRRIHPVGAIYIGRKLTLAVFSIMIILSFWFMVKITKSYLVSYIYALFLFLDPQVSRWSLIIKPEIYVALFVMLSYLSYVICIKQKNYRYFIFQCVFCGLAVGAKLTSIALVSLLFFSAFSLSRMKGSFSLVQFLKLCLLGIIITGVVFIITNPAILFKFKRYYRMMKWVYEGHHPEITPWRGNFQTFLHWLNFNTLICYRWISSKWLLILAIVSAILFFIRHRLLFLGTLLFLGLNIYQNITTAGLCPRLFVHLNSVLYFFILFPISEVVIDGLNKGIRFLFKTRSRSVLYSLYTFDKLIFVILLFHFSIVNIGWLKNYTKPPKCISDSRLVLLDYVKKHPDKYFIYNFHYYFMPEEFEKLDNVVYFEDISELEDIRAGKESQYLVYFEEKGGYSGFLRHEISLRHREAMEYFRKYPKVKAIEGNFRNGFGFQSPQANPKVVIRKIYG